MANTEATNNPPQLQSWFDFVKYQKANDEHVLFKLIYADISGDLVTGVLLSQIVYWHLPGKERQTKLSVKKNGKRWLAKKRTDWYKECRVTPKQADRSLAILKKKGVIDLEVYKYDGAPTHHIRINPITFCQLLNEHMKKMVIDDHELDDDYIIPFFPKGENGNPPKVKMEMTDRCNSITEITTETTAEKRSIDQDEPDREKIVHFYKTFDESYCGQEGTMTTDYDLVECRDCITEFLTPTPKTVYVNCDGCEPMVIVTGLPPTVKEVIHMPNCTLNNKEERPSTPLSEAPPSPTEKKVIHYNDGKPGLPCDRSIVGGSMVRTTDRMAVTCSGCSDVIDVLEWPGLVVNEVKKRGDDPRSKHGVARLGEEVKTCPICKKRHTNQKYPTCTNYCWVEYCERQERNSSPISTALVPVDPDTLPATQKSTGGSPVKSEGYSHLFEAWWKVYPRKIAKKTAYKAWKKAVRDCFEGDEARAWGEIMVPLAKQIEYTWHKRDKKHIPHPSTWLNGEQWNDEVEIPVDQQVDQWDDQIDEFLGGDE